MNTCEKIYAADYTSKTTGETTRRAVAKFTDGQEFIFAKPLDEVKQMIADGRTKAEVVVVEGQYGRYAAFSAFTNTEELA